MSISDPTRSACREAAEPKCSPCEIGVLQCFIDHGSISDVADALYISIHTVRAHLRSIRRKTGIHPLPLLLRWTLTRGLVSVLWLGRTGAPGPGDCTPAELRALQALFDAGTLQAAAELLGVSRWTVATEIRNLRCRTGFRHLPQLIAWGVGTGGLRLSESPASPCSAGVDDQCSDLSPSPADGHHVLAGENT